MRNIRGLALTHSIFARAFSLRIALDDGSLKRIYTDANIECSCSSGENMPPEAQCIGRAPAPELAGNLQSRSLRQPVYLQVPRERRERRPPSTLRRWQDFSARELHSTGTFNICKFILIDRPQATFAVGLSDGDPETTQVLNSLGIFGPGTANIAYIWAANV